MRLLRCLLAGWLPPLALLYTPASLVFGQSGNPAPPESAASRPLDKVISLRLEGDLSLSQAVAAIGESVGIEITIDRRGVVEAVGDLEDARFTAPTGRRKASEHLDRLLAPEGLTLVQVGKGWVVTSEERAFAFQMRQKLDVDWREQSLASAMEGLATQKGLNLVLDPRQAEAGKKMVTLKLKDATLESVLRLAAEVAGLKPVRVGNVVFLTTANGAKSLRAEAGLTDGGGVIDPATFFEPDRFTGPAPALLPPLQPVPGPVAPARLPHPGPAAPPPGVPPAGGVGGPGAGGAPFFNARGV